jgi:4a-hydroxytetrahydrobiopterin dehydratase
MTDLAAEKCEACTRDTPVLTPAEVETLLRDLHKDWTVQRNTMLRREFRFPTFNASFTRATSIAMLAEGEGHHPEMLVGWGRLVVELTTHAIEGLSRNDFILAARIDQIGETADPD